LHGDPHAKNILVFADPDNHYQDLRDAIGSSKFGIKLTDLGTSQLMGRAPTELREATIILETAREIWAPAKLNDEIDLSASSDLRFVIAALDSLAEYRWSISEKLQFDGDDNYKRSAIIPIANQLSAVPVYRQYKVG
jgi:hypothetical protein